ncbi:hypothetical protein FS935_01355 [Metabacillus litoralis]|uniref:Uncharacterized protein n=1 Tax=Metabacillus litoralis TaxID=152268 RepID=A0A5C6W8V4_9BACI|nr:hypothetical protein [Metabacillus litoralis]TXC92868.1 hypothetical protein FS935_01355 [Metabacillus litoralis]
MFNLLIFLIITLIGITLYLTTKNKKIPWKFIMIFVLIMIGVLLLIGYRFTPYSALPTGTKAVISEDTIYGKAILYEDINNNTFGLANIYRNIGFLYHYAGGTSDYFIEENEPFEAAGFGRDEEDGFMVGVRTRDPNIKYIVVGNHIEKVKLSDSYNFTMDTVVKYQDSYHLEEVVNNHALFVLDEYSEATWTIRALDKDGHLIADKLFGAGEARYIDW